MLLVIVKLLMHSENLIVSRIWFMKIDKNPPISFEAPISFFVNAKLKRISYSVLLPFLLVYT